MFDHNYSSSYGPFSPDASKTRLIISCDRLVLTNLVDTISYNVRSYHFDINTLSRTFPFPTNSSLTVYLRYTPDVALALKAFQDEDLTIHIEDYATGNLFELTTVWLRDYKTSETFLLGADGEGTLIQVTFLFGKITNV